MSGIFKRVRRFTAVILLALALSTFPGVPAAAAAGITVDYSPIESRSDKGTPAADEDAGGAVAAGMSLMESLSGSTWKVENPSALYDDVDANDPDYAALKYVNDAGIMGGTGARRFEPDAKVSYRILSVVCLRAFLPDVRTRNAFEYMLSCGYLDLSLQDIDQYNTYVTWENAMAVIGRCCGILPVLMYDAAEPELPVVKYDDTSAFRYMTEVGGVYSVWNFSTRSAVTNLDTLTRRDLARILYDIHVWQDADPENVTKYGFGYVDVSASDKYKHLIESAWSDVIQAPIEITTSFHSAGFKIYLDGAHIAEYARANGVNGVVGLFSQANKTIYSVSFATVLHEFGHYLDYMMVQNRGLYTGLYAEEKAAAKVLLSDYGTTSATEFFAEAFNYYARNRNDAAKLAEMAEKMPGTYGLMRDLEARGWYVGGGQLTDANADNAGAAGSNPGNGVVSYGSGTGNGPEAPAGKTVIAAWSADGPQDACLVR